MNPLTLVCVLVCLSVCVKVTNAGMDLTNYKMTWNQDFSLLANLSVTPSGPCGDGGSTWIAHTPYGGDWNNFENPSGDYKPFYLGNGGPLVIRAYGEGTTLYSGLLSSVDGQARGFSQKYGYFEMRAQLPKGPGTWPAFWLDDIYFNNKTIGHHEIDILEAYGDGTAILRSTLHWWDPDGSKNWGQGWAAPSCSMTTGMHTYGMDIQADTITFYYDRTMILQTPNTIPNGHGSYDRPLYVMVDLAYGGGGSGNNISYIFDHPQDMLVDYVRVWQGQDGSKNARDTSDAPALSWWTAGSYWQPDFPGWVMYGNETVAISGVTLSLPASGRLTVSNMNGLILYQTDIPDVSPPCDASCKVAFQNDGNLVIYSAKGAYWGSGTYGNNGALFTFMNEPPYLAIYSPMCDQLWSTANKTHSFEQSYRVSDE